MIAFDVLRQLGAADCEVSLFVTLGSPLGLPQVRSMFKRWTGTRKLSFPECVQRWINVAETRDPIALDPDLTGDIANAKGRFENLAAARLNPDWQQNLHSASGYLSIPQVRAAVRQAVGVGFDQPVSNAVLIKDLSEQLEAHGPEHRHDVLIELDRRVLGNDPAGVRALLLQHVREAGARTTGLSGEALDEAIELEDSLQRFVSARLTRFEIESLQEHYRAFGFRRVWRDAGKRALIHESGNVLHADAAHTAYRARGQQIGWAVLDTGIAASHPHFFVKGERDNVVAQWDCTRRGAPKPLTRADGVSFTRLDQHGHGTHIAAIIAGVRSTVAAPEHARRWWRLSGLRRGKASQQWRGHDQRRQVVAHLCSLGLEPFELRALHLWRARQDPQVLAIRLADHRPLIVRVERDHPIIGPHQR